MFLKKISFVLLAVLLGMAMALIRPAQPKQVEQPAAVPKFYAQGSLDNENIPLENSIHNSRKCTCHLLRSYSTTCFQRREYSNGFIFL